jgi:hypothetical protein
MELRRICIHEAGHFYLALSYSSERAVSIRVGREIKQDSITGKNFTSLGTAMTWTPFEANPRVDVAVRAAGLAAESLVYGESFDALISDPNVKQLIKTDTDNAKWDLNRANIRPQNEDHFINVYFRMGFQDAVTIMQGSQDRLNRIADYCLANQGREIPADELVGACDLR